MKRKQTVKFDHLWSNSIRIALMLSCPRRPLLSFAVYPSKRCNRIVSFLIYSCSFLLIHSTISLGDLFSQMPSQPIKIKSILSFFSFIMSGFAETACSSWGRGDFLYVRSPNARERSKIPSTRPLYTFHYVFLIRLRSSGSVGLWSWLSSKHSPDTHATALLSPEFAQKIFSGVIRTTLAVQPASDYQPFGAFSSYNYFFSEYPRYFYFSLLCL